MSLEIYDKYDITKYLKPVQGERIRLVYEDGLFKLYDNLFNFCVMSNSIQEKELCLNIIEHSFGEVLIAGFGIGLIVLPIMNKIEVESIEIVELQKEVIDLISTQLTLNDKVKIINDNIYSYIPEKKYDTIYVDTVSVEMCNDREKIVRNINGDLRDDNYIFELFKSYLKKDGKIIRWDCRFLKCKDDEEFTELLQQSFYHLVK